MKYLRLIGFLFGAGLFLWVLAKSDLSSVWQQVKSFSGWRFAVIFLFYGGILGLDTLGWQFALSRTARDRVRWDRLFRTRLAGEAMNYVIPTAMIGGEPVKAILLLKRYGVPMPEGMASVVIAKTTFAVSMMFFVLTGLAMTLATQAIPDSVARWVWITFPCLSLLMALFIGFQFFQPFARSGKFFGRFMPGWFEKIVSKAMEWDHAIVSYYRENPGRLFWSFGFHFLGWMAGAVEVYLILNFLGIAVSLPLAWSLEALWLLLRSGAFIIPASLGASEGFLLLLCVGFGISGVAGLAMALIRRAREMLWIALGLVEFSRR